LARVSLHREPIGGLDVLRHYIRDVVYGANDGIITTFAVVAGVTGGALSARTIIVVGIANLLADGLSMGVGNYLSIRSNESAREAVDLPEEEASPARHGAMTFLAFVVAGSIPMLPYFFGLADFALCIFMTLAGLFALGSLRALVTIQRWWIAGLEMLGLGIVVAGVAYGSGAAAAWAFG
jgi:VIT1/CCC1 family predicted Fe2+/Mn2+ transporter